MGRVYHRPNVTAHRRRLALDARLMTVSLRHTGDLSGVKENVRWCTVLDAATPLGNRPKLANCASRLEIAFEAIRDTWWQLGKSIGTTPSAELAHMPTTGTYASDFGVALAWVELVRQLSQEAEPTLIICNDPWLFRRLSTLNGVRAGSAPGLWFRECKLLLRGFFSRLRLIWRLIITTLKYRSLKNKSKSASSVLIVYGHPDSRTDGFDAYFGSLMKDFPTLQRLMHTDCSDHRVRELAADGRTTPLSAWGQLSWILPLLYTRWRPEREQLQGEEGWLIRRAAIIEGSGGAAAMTRWQIHCQSAWLADTRPACIAWPWENHPWERDITRQAKRLGISTIGFQHTVIGPHMFGQSPASNIDGLDSIPDMIVCNGPAYWANLAEWGIPVQRLSIGGNLRLAEQNGFKYNPAGPIFVALPGHLEFAKQMMKAVYPLGLNGHDFLFKVHPMYDFSFDETDNIKRTFAPLEELPGVSAVLYCLGTIGLEALLRGMPTLRFRPQGDIALNTLPTTLNACAVDSETLATALTSLHKPEVPEPGTILSSFDHNVWKQVLQC